MTLNYRRKRRSVSGTLLVTFVLGIGIGFTLCYALMEMVREDDATYNKQMRESARSLEPAASPPEPSLPATPPEAVSSPAVPWPARHLLIGVRGPILDEGAVSILHTFALGGVVLHGETGQEPDQTRILADGIRQTASGAPSAAAAPLIAAYLAMDAGNPLRIEDAISPREIAAIESIEEVRALGQRLGQAYRRRGVDLVFGPFLNVFQPGVSEPALEPMTFANDDVKVTETGLALAAGLIEGGILAIPARYPGEGSAVLDASGVRVVQEDDLTALEAMIQPFDAAAQQEMPGLLVGQVAVPALEDEGPLVPAAFSERLVRMLLRDMRSFKGVLIADDISATAPRAGRTLEQAAVDALAAGCDAVLLLDADVAAISSVCSAIDAAVQEGVLSKESLDVSAERLAGLRTRIHADALTPAADDTSVQTVSEPALPLAVNHTVAEGETLSSIALRHGVSVADLQQWNSLGRSAVIKLGQELRVCAPVPAPEPEGAPATEPEASSEPSATPAPASPPPEASQPVNEEPVPVPEQPSDAAPAEPPAVEPPPTLELPPPAEAPPTATTEAELSEERAPVTAEPAQADVPEDLPPGAAPPNSEHRVYRIAPGDTLETVANQYGVTAAEIRRWNGLASDRLNPGGQLDIYLPRASKGGPSETADFEYYRVTDGDTLHSIALRHGVTVSELLKINEISNPNVLLKGQRLRIPKPR